MTLEQLLCRKLYSSREGMRCAVSHGQVRINEQVIDITHLGMRAESLPLGTKVAFYQRVYYVGDGSRMDVENQQLSLLVS